MRCVAWTAHEKDKMENEISPSGERFEWEKVFVDWCASLYYCPKLLVYSYAEAMYTSASGELLPDFSTSSPMTQRWGPAHLQLGCATVSPNSPTSAMVSPGTIVPVGGVDATPAHKPRHPNTILFTSVFHAIRTLPWFVPGGFYFLVQCIAGKPIHFKLMQPVS